MNGMAAVAATFGKYLVELTGAGIPDAVIAVGALLILTVINCLGVRSGSNTQSALMLLKLVAIAALVVAGFAFGKSHWASHPILDAPLSSDLLVRIGAAMTPVMVSTRSGQYSFARRRTASKPVVRALLTESIPELPLTPDRIFDKLGSRP